MGEFSSTYIKFLFGKNFQSKGGLAAGTSIAAFPAAPLIIANGRIRTYMAG